MEYVAQQQIEDMRRQRDALLAQMEDDAAKLAQAQIELDEAQSLFDEAKSAWGAALLRYRGSPSNVNISAEQWRMDSGADHAKQESIRQTAHDAEAVYLRVRDEVLEPALVKRNSIDHRISNNRGSLRMVEMRISQAEAALEQQATTKPDKPDLRSALASVRRRLSGVR